jgi:precorrin-2 dehydrogenase
MGYLPIFLDVTDRPCLVVGGGEVAARKAQSLCAAGARVTVISPQVNSELGDLARAGKIVHLNRRFKRGDMRGCVLVFAATDDPALHRALAAEARELAIPLNVADVPELCTFIAPAVISQGALQIAISTGGASPAYAARLRRELERRFGREHAVTLEILRAARKHLRASGIDAAERMRRLKILADAPIEQALRDGDRPAVERILSIHLGAGVGLAELGIEAGDASIGPAPRAAH